MIEGQNLHIIVVAAGSGSRFGADVPKQFCLLHDKPVLMWTIDRLRQCCPEANIVLVLSESGLKLWHQLCGQYNYETPRTVIGGNTRWQSVHNALEVLQTSDNDIIMVHDGARPLVDKAVFDRIMQAMEVSLSVIPCTAMVDSLRLVGVDGVNTPLDRSIVRSVQTPQAFRAGALYKAYSHDYDESFTDDASVMAAAGYPPPLIVDGSPKCLKITHPIDLKIATFYIDDERSTVD